MANNKNINKFEYLIHKLPDELQKRWNAPERITLEQLKRNIFAWENESQNGASYKDFRKINGAWHHVKKDGSFYAYGLSRPRKDIEEKYIASLPNYKEYVEGDAYFS